MQELSGRRVVALTSNNHIDPDLAVEAFILEPAETAAGYISRQRNGRRNHYTINVHLPLPEAIAREQSIGELLTILTATHGSKQPTSRRT